MKGRAFLDLAHELLLGQTEAHWRGAVIHAYYGLMLEGRDTLESWGFPLPPRQSVHAFVRLRFTFASSPDLKQIGDILDDLVQLRNRASYDLSRLPEFASSVCARQAVADATTALASLDAINGNPASRAKAIAALPP